MTTSWVDPQYLGAIVALAWAQSQAEALREERGASADPCRPCSGVGSAVMVDAKETAHVVPCGPCSGTGTNSRLAW